MSIRTDYDIGARSNFILEFANSSLGLKIDKPMICHQFAALRLLAELPLEGQYMNVNPESSVVIGSKLGLAVPHRQVALYVARLSHRV